MKAEEFLNSTLTEAVESAFLTSKTSYRKNYRYINITSNSQQDVLHECPRKFQQIKIVRAGADAYELGLVNVDLIFGQTVGAMVQTYASTGSRLQAFFAGFLCWTTDLDAALEKKGKSFYLALLALDKFIPLWEELKENWEVARFNNRSASELSFWIDCENGYYHAGHIDLVLRNKKTGVYMVVDFKTTSKKEPDEAQYGNSGQTLGYSIVVDAVAGTEGGISTFEVLYLSYSSTGRKWYSFPFKKFREERAEWLQDLLLDHTTIATYRKLHLFPKRGNACWSFSRRCTHYGICDFQTNRTTDSFEVWKPELGGFPEKFDFTFRLSELVGAQ